MNEEWKARLEKLQEQFPTATALADAMGVHRTQITKLLNGHENIGPKHQYRIKQLEYRLETQSKQSATIEGGIRVMFPLDSEVPYYTTSVRAGEPTIMYDSTIAKLNLRDRFVVEITGQSMQGAGFHAGDLVIFRKTPDARDGDCVLIRIGEQYTFKVLSRDNGHVQLLPANSNYDPIVVNPLDDVEVIGVAEYRFERVKHYKTKTK